MHPSSLSHMSGLAHTYLTGRPPGLVVDIGAYDVNGTYRPIFEASGWRYLGVDLAAGPNVDKVMADPYSIPLADCAADLVVSGQAFEHIEFFWLTFTEVARILKPGGLFFLIAPSRGPEHRHPVDCWRFYPDGYRALAAWAKIEVLEARTDWLPPGAPPDSDAWGDSVGVFRKPERALRRQGAWARLRAALRTRRHSRA